MTTAGHITMPGTSSMSGALRGQTLPKIRSAMLWSAGAIAKSRSLGIAQVHPANTSFKQRAEQSSGRPKKAAALRLLWFMRYVEAILGPPFAIEQPAWLIPRALQSLPTPRSLANAQDKSPLVRR